MSKVTGIVNVIEETKTYGQKGFRKRLVVLMNSSGSHENYVPIDFIQDACDDVDELNIGDNVTIEYELKGRKWQKDAGSDVRYFLNAEARGFTKIGGAQNSSPPPSESEFGGEPDDDIPF